jgi:predicted ATPase/DNA-binding NarL/FixJ family response regulator
VSEQSTNSFPSSLNTFVGRARERARLARLIASHRLVTVVGPAGVGKTRLVAEAIPAWGRRFPAARWWLDLTAIGEPDLVERFLTDQLGLRPHTGSNLFEVLATRLADQRALLVLDNCEHLLEVVARIASELVARVPLLAILATSRERLGTAGEAVLALDALPTEDAVRLFINRARLRLPDFQPMGRVRIELTQLCERIDNLPLAVELAAARVALMSPKDMLERLDRRFQLLATRTQEHPDRHRSIRAALDWSYRLLDSADEQLLSRLAALPGHFDLQTAEAIGGSEALEGLARLIDKSLVLASSTERGMRYRMLEAIRDYGLERLREAGETQAVGDRILDHFLNSIEIAYEERMTSGSDSLFLLLADNSDNIRAALEHTNTSRPAESLRMAGAMREHWVRWNPSEGRLWLQRLIASYPYRDRYLARGLLALGHLAAAAEHDYAAARAALEQSRDVCVAVEDSSGEAWATFLLGLAATLANDFVPARRDVERALVMQQANSSPYGVLQARATLGQLLAISGQDLNQSRRLLEDVLATSKRLGNRWSSGHAHTFLGLLDLREQQRAPASAEFRQAIAEFEAVGDQVLLAAALSGLARSIVTDDVGRGLQLAAAASAIHARLGSRFAPVWASLIEETKAQAASKLGTAAAGPAWESGRRLTVPEALALLGLKPWPSRMGGLTRREIEVARLIAGGDSNRAVAEHLHLSERTVEAHVMHILNKLGLTSRSQIARWIVEESSTS